jgi:hypothetical protein
MPLAVPVVETWSRREQLPALLTVWMPWGARGVDSFLCNLGWIDHVLLLEYQDRPT